MINMEESNPPRSEFISLFSRLFQRLIGRAALVDAPLIKPVIPELVIPELVLEISERNFRIERFNLDMHMPVSNTFDLIDRNVLNECLRRERHTDPIMRDFRFFQNAQNNWWNEQEPFFRHQQQTAPEEAYQWWCHQNSFAALPDPVDFLNSSKLAGNPDLDIPEAFICAITREIMTDPVYDPDFPQQRYDRHVIERWLTDHPTNPCTRTRLTVANLVADDDLKARIDEFVANVLQTSATLLNVDLAL